MNIHANFLNNTSLKTFYNNNVSDIYCIENIALSYLGDVYLFNMLYFKMSCMYCCSCQSNETPT